MNTPPDGNPAGSRPPITPLPCPFCGVSKLSGSYPEKFLSIGCFSRHDWFVSCRGCGCMKQGHKDEEAAIAAWNTRLASCEALRAEVAGLREALKVASGILHAVLREDINDPETEIQEPLTAIDALLAGSTAPTPDL